MDGVKWLLISESYLGLTLDLWKKRAGIWCNVSLYLRFALREWGCVQRDVRTRVAGGAGEDGWEGCPLEAGGRATGHLQRYSVC